MGKNFSATRLPRAILTGLLSSFADSDVLGVLRTSSVTLSFEGIVYLAVAVVVLVVTGFVFGLNFSLAFGPYSFEAGAEACPTCAFAFGVRGSSIAFFLVEPFVGLAVTVVVQSVARFFGCREFFAGALPPYALYASLYAFGAFSLIGFTAWAFVSVFAETGLLCVDFFVAVVVNVVATDFGCPWVDRCVVIVAVFALGPSVFVVILFDAFSFNAVAVFVAIVAGVAFKRSNFSSAPHSKQAKQN